MISTKPEPASTAPTANPVPESSSPIPNPNGAARARRSPPLRHQNLSFRSAAWIFPDAKFEAGLTSLNELSKNLSMIKRIGIFRAIFYLVNTRKRYPEMPVEAGPPQFAHFTAPSGIRCLHQRHLRRGAFSTF